MATATVMFKGCCQGSCNCFCRLVGWLKHCNLSLSLCLLAVCDYENWKNRVRCSTIFSSCVRCAFTPRSQRSTPFQYNDSICIHPGLVALSLSQPAARPSPRESSTWLGWTLRFVNAKRTPCRKTMLGRVIHFRRKMLLLEAVTQAKCHSRKRVSDGMEARLLAESVRSIRDTSLLGAISMRRSTRQQGLQASTNYTVC